MSMSEWAKHEVELACEREGDFEYGRFCYESALKAYLSLCEDEHTGMSFGFARDILTRLMNVRPLTPLTGKDDEWNLVGEYKDGRKEYQNKRMHSIFKKVSPDGHVEHSANNYYCVDEETGSTYFSGHARSILEQYIEPIEFPYYPPVKDYVIHVNTYLTNRKNGDFDTKEYTYIVCPDGKRIDVHRYFGETENGWEELTKKEFDSRVIAHFVREAREKIEAKREEG